VLAALGVAALAIAASLWWSNAALVSPAQALPCNPQPAAAKALDTAAIGELAALNGTGTGRGYADLRFLDATGTPHTLKDFAGKTLLVNFWASWCVPCRAEMPALDKLAAEENGPDFAVLSLNSSEPDPQKGRAFFDAGGWPHLTYAAEQSFNDAFGRLQTSAVAVGLPTSLLLDKKGCEIAVLQGPAAWDTPDGKHVIDALKAI
jgi:thiol-disulfide isomerase/thioredoxin